MSDLVTIPESLRALCGDRLKVNEPLAPYVSFQLGGPADLFLAADSLDLAGQAIAAAQAAGLPWLVLGRGSNVLISDRGVRGLVVRIQASGLRIDEAAGAVHAEAGVRLANLAVATAVVLYEIFNQRRRAPLTDRTYEVG